MNQKMVSTKKVTFYLPINLIDEIKDIVKGGIAPSQNAFVQKALTQEVKKARDKMLRDEFAEAAKDPLFLQDLNETEEAFESADAQTSRMIPE